MILTRLFKMPTGRIQASNLIALAGLISVLGIPLSVAQSPDQAPRKGSVLEEIIVTATKRSESLQDVGIAITALSGEQMEALGFASAQQVTTFAPGVSTVQPNGEANYSIGIRGVTNSDFTTNVESPVAVYVDEVYISQASGTGFALFDMERAEILRGPQGTLFGRNATGGLAHFITRKPSQEFDAYIKATVGDYSQIKFEGAVGGSLGGDWSIRASVSTHDNDGYIKNRHPTEGGDLNNANDFAGRLQVLYEPSDNFSLLLNARTSTQDIDTGFFEHVTSLATHPTALDPNTGDPLEIAGVLTPTLRNVVLDYLDNDGDVYAGSYDDPGFNDLETNGYSATVKWAITDALNFTSVTDSSTTERTYIEDSDASPVPFFNFFLTTDAEQLSQEIRFDYEGERFKWLAGVYYLKLDIEDTNGAITDPFYGLLTESAGATTVTGTGAGAVNAEGGLFNPYTSELTSISIFGQIEFALSERWSLIAGLRNIKDEKDFTYSANVVEFLNPASKPGFDAASNMGSLASLAEYTGDRSDSDIAGRLQVDWKYSDDGLVYFAFNRGVRGGGFNAPVFPLTTEVPMTNADGVWINEAGAVVTTAAAAAQVPTGLAYDDATLSYEPEQLDAYEIGFKTKLGTIGRLNAAAYYYDYSKYQLFTITGIDTLSVNSPEAEAKGFELELQLTPGNRWDILLGFAYNDVSADLPSNAGSVTPVQSPEININGLLRYSFPVGSGEISLQADADYRDEVFFALTGAPAVTQDAYTVANVSISYSQQNWRLSAFVQNVLDEEYQVQAFDLSTTAVFGFTEQYYGRPQWWGVSFRYDW